MIKKPHFICWILAIVFVLFGYFVPKQYTIDIQLHDTYILLDYRVIGWIFGFIFLWLGLAYWMVDRIKGRLVTWMTFGHIGLTAAIFLLTILSPLVEGKIGSMAYLGDQNVIWSLMVWVFAQLIFVVNFLRAIVLTGKKH